MGLMHSPKIVTDGLVLCIDSGNLKSYKGPPVQNILTHLTGSIINATGIVFNRGTEVVNIPEVGTVTSVTVTGYNDYPALSTACCPNLYSYYASYLNVSPNTLYTYAILYKVDSGYTHPNFMYRYEYTSGNAYVTEAGVHSNTNRVHLGNGWYWAWGTFTTQATTAKISTFSFYYQTRTSANPDKMSVAKVLLTKGDYTQLHPKYWVDVNTTRSNTQAILDLTGKNTLTVNNLAYNSDGTYSFNGTNSYIDAGNATDLQQSQTFSADAWVRITDLTNSSEIFSKGNGLSGDGNLGWALSYYSVTNTLYFDTYSTTTRYASVIAHENSTNWFNIAITFDSGVKKMYVNGVLKRTDNVPHTIGNTTYNLTVSEGFTWQSLIGYVPALRYYKRVLSDSEVKQNFNALRGRFGI